MKLRNKQEVEDFVRGCTFYGTGGGGLPENGIESLMSLIDKGHEIEWIDPNEISDDAITVCPFLMGSIAPHTDEVKKEMKGFGLGEPLYNEREQLAKAMESLGEYLDVKIEALIPIELGGANTPGGISAGLTNGYICVDGDYTGRAIPEILQTTPYINNKDIWPIASFDAYGNKAFIDEALNYRMVERIGKLIASGSYGLAGQAGFIMTGKEMKEIIIEGTLTESYELGKAIRKARENNENPIDAIVDKLDGYILCEGKTVGKDEDDRLGYYWGTHIIQGSGEYEGNEYKVWFKNENHIMWENDEAIASSPDMITIVNKKTGEPYANPVLEVGEEVVVIGVDAREEFLNERALSVFSAKYFGYDDIEYIPLKERFSEK